MQKRFKQKRAPRRKAPVRRFVGLPRSMYNMRPVFTETWDAGPLVIAASTNTLSGGFNMSFSSLPQAAQYRNLYRQFRILRNTWILLPRYTEADVNGAPLNYQCGRIAYAINDTAGQTNPATELAVLESNGSKVTNTNRRLTISHVPISIQDVAVNSIVPANVYRNQKRQWFNTANASNQGSGENVLHGFVSWFITQPSGSSGATGITLYDVYCKTPVQFADPA
jgi:hypothetical protein